jgi:chromosome segregation ATPase
MAVSRALRRLLRVLSLEEEQCRLELEAALGDLRQWEHALSATAERARGGRRLVQASARTGELPDRLAGLEETSAAIRRATALEARIEQAEREVEELRLAFLDKRVEYRQAETLIREAEARDAVVAARRGQQALDDWYLNRLRLLAAGREPSSQEPSKPEDLAGGSKYPIDAT